MDVIKMGGAAGVDLDALVADLAASWREGRRFVLMHGGSDETNRLAESLGHPPRFVTSESGMTSRVTDRRTLEIFMMATAAVNRRLVEGLHAAGADAFGLSGMDGRLIEGTRKAAIRVIENGRRRVIRDDWTGRPQRINTALLGRLLESGLLPVVAPLAVSPAGEPLNIDGDRGAAAVAAALRAENLIILTNVPGLLRDPDRPDTLVEHIPESSLDEAAALARGRMKKKILGAREALAGGVGRVIIADGRLGRPLAAALEGRGTVLGAPLARPAGACGQVVS